MALNINGWDACFAQQVVAITPQIWHIIFRLRRKRFLHTDLFGQQECCYARPFQIFWRHGHSCCLFRCCAQKSVQTRPVQDGYCVSPVTTLHCWAVDWTLPWHEILHHWNERAKILTARHGLKIWSVVCLKQFWIFANYVSTLPRERWVVRALNWLPEHARRVGRPAYSWDSMIQSFCRHWNLLNLKCRYHLLCAPAPWKGCLFGHAGLTHLLWTATSQKNNMVSVLDDAWRNICSPQIYSSIRPWRQTFRCGYWVWACQKFLIEEIGVPCG